MVSVRYAGSGFLKTQEAFKGFWDVSAEVQSVPRPFNAFQGILGAFSAFQVVSRDLVTHQEPSETP